MTTSRKHLATWWNDAWTAGLWAAAWSKSINDLTPAQAAWQPRDVNGKARHSIWQHISHMIFWREDALRRLTDPTKPSEEALARLNFPTNPDATSPGASRAWEDTRARFKASQDAIAAKLAEASSDISRLQYMLPHDCYHFGQINLLRALQGLAPIE